MKTLLKAPWNVSRAGSVKQAEAWTKTEVWGRRRLAYVIRKQTEGLYVLMNISLDPKSASDLERNIRFLEPVIRHLLTVVS